MLYVPPPPFRALWASETARVFAGQIMSIVLPWMYLHLVHSSEWYGYLMAATSVPRILGAASASWFNTKRPALSVMRVASIVAAVCAVGLVTCFSFSFPRLWALLPFVLLMAFTEGVYFPAIGTAVPQMLPEESWQQANTLIQSTNQIGRMLLSFVLSPIAAKMSYWTSFSCVAALYVFTSAVLPRNQKHARPEQQEEALGIGAHGEHGDHVADHGGTTSSAETESEEAKPSSAFWRRPDFLILLGLTLGINIGYIGPTGVGIPLFVRSALHGNASTYALMVGCEAAGSVAGAFLLMMTRRYRLTVYHLLYGLYAGTFFWLVIPVLPHVAWTACFMALSMMAFTWVNIQSISLIQVWFRGPSLGAVMSVLWTASMILGPVSYAMDGALLQWLAIPTLFVASACFIGAIVTAALFCVRIRPQWLPEQP